MALHVHVETSDLYVVSWALVEIEISTTSPQYVHANLKSDSLLNYKVSSSFLTENIVYIRRANRLILYREIIGVNCETHTNATWHHAVNCCYSG